MPPAPTMPIFMVLSLMETGWSNANGFFGRRVQKLLFPHETCPHISGMIHQHFAVSRHCRCPSPVALQFCRECHPRYWDHTCLNHALNGHFMRFDADAAGCVG